MENLNYVEKKSLLECCFRTTCSHGSRMKTKFDFPRSKYRQNIFLVVLIVLFFVVSESAAFASEPGGTSLIVFLAGMVFAPIVQLIVYPILIFADQLKTWTVVAFGLVSVLWSCYVSYSLADRYSTLYFVFTIVLFVFAYFKKVSRLNIKQHKD